MSRSILCTFLCILTWLVPRFVAAEPANLVEIDGNAVGFNEPPNPANASQPSGTIAGTANVELSGTPNDSNINSSQEPDLSGINATELDPTNLYHQMYLGDADGGSYIQHHNDISGGKWAYKSELDKNASPFVGNIFQGVHFFYRDEVLKHFKPKANTYFQVQGKVEVGCKGRWDGLDGNQRFKLQANNEGNGGERIFSFHHCHIHKCKKTRPVCFGIFVTVTAGKELVDANNYLMTPLPPNYRVECHGSTYWKVRSGCQVISDNGGGWKGPSETQNFLGKTTIEKRTPATYAPGTEREQTYKQARHLNNE